MSKQPVLHYAPADTRFGANWRTECGYILPPKQCVTNPLEATCKRCLNQAIHKQSLCTGCDQDYYNGQGAKECWNLKSAKVVRKLRIGWWTPMDKKENFKPAIKLSCYTQTGKVLYVSELPKHLR